MNLQNIINQCKSEWSAFLEILGSVKTMLLSSVQAKPKLRYQAKLSLEKAPFLTCVGLSVMGLLFLLVFILAITTKGGFFVGAAILLLLLMVALVTIVVGILFARPIDGMTAKVESSIEMGDVAVSERPETSNVRPSTTKQDTDMPQSGDTIRGKSFYGAQVGIGLGIAVCSIIVYNIVDKPGVVSGCILIGLICTAVSMIADNLVSIYTLVFVDKNQSIPAIRLKVLQWVARLVVGLPLLFPIYGAAKGAYEVVTSEHKGSQVTFNLVRYKLTCLDMNWFSRLGYRLAYHSLLDFEEDGSSKRTGAGVLADTGMRQEIPVVDTSDAIDINYVNHSSLSSGAICKITNYRVFVTGDGYVIASFDYVQSANTKSLARQFFGNDVVNLSEMAENSSKPNIVIFSKRDFCDGDSIPMLYARYEGTVKTAVGRLRCFREVQSIR